MHRDRKVRRRAAEHVGQDRDAVAGVDALHRFDDVLAALLDVVVGADGHGLDLLLRTDHVLQRRAELDGKPPVGDENETDHRELPAGASGCTARKGAHHDHPKPERKGLSWLLAMMLHCGKRRP